MDGSTIICTCEEINADEIIEAVNNGAVTLNDIKRMTRCGMGPCQTKNCFYLISELIVEHTNIKVEDFMPMNVRTPLKPTRLENLANSADNAPSMTLLDKISTERNKGE